MYIWHNKQSTHRVHKAVFWSTKDIQHLAKLCHKLEYIIQYRVHVQYYKTVILHKNSVLYNIFQFITQLRQNVVYDAAIKDDVLNVLK